MLKVDGLKSALMTAHGAPYQNDQGKYGFIFREALGSMNEGTANELMDAYALAIKIGQNESIELEKAEVELLKKALKSMKVTNLMGQSEKLSAHIFGQCMMKLEEPAK